VHENWVAIGRLLRARGNRGELIGELDSAQPDREKKLKDVALEADGRRQEVRIQEVWRSPTLYEGRPVFKFEGVDSISDAEKWEGATILVPESQLAPPAEGEYSYTDLVGCRLADAKSGVSIGIVENVEEYGGPVLLKVRGADGQVVLIPFARSICTEIDTASKTIRVELPEGLMELQ
jgi:16S rRNA processing protein RimM